MLRRLAGLEIWAALLAVGLSAVFESLLLPAALAMACFWPLRWLAYGRISRGSPADWAIGLLALTALVNIGVTTGIEATRVQALRLWSGIGLYYAIVNWRGTAERFHWAAAGAGAALLAFSGYAFLSVDWPARVAQWLGQWIQQPRQWLPGDVVNANVLAGSMALVIPLCLAAGLAALSRRRFAGGLLLVLIALASGGVLVISGSRGAWLGLAAGCCVMFALAWRWGWAALLPAAGLAAAAMTWLPRGWERLLEALTAGTVLGGFSERIDVWARAVTIIQDFPFSGVGLGGFGDTIAWLYPLYPVPKEAVSHAHNLYLQIGVDLGLPGLIAWLAAFIGVWAALHGFYTQRRGMAAANWMQRALALGLLGSLAALAVHGLMDAVTWGMVRSAPLVWVVWGLAAALTVEAGQESAHVA